MNDQNREQLLEDDAEEQLGDHGFPEIPLDIIAEDKPEQDIAEAIDNPLQDHKEEQKNEQIMQNNERRLIAAARRIINKRQLTEMIKEAKLEDEKNFPIIDFTNQYGEKNPGIVFGFIKNIESRVSYGEIVKRLKILVAGNSGNNRSVTWMVDGKEATLTDFLWSPYLNSKLLVSSILAGINTESIEKMAGPRGEYSWTGSFKNKLSSFHKHAIILEQARAETFKFMEDNNQQINNNTIDTYYVTLLAFTLKNCPHASTEKEEDSSFRKMFRKLGFRYDQENAIGHLLSAFSEVIPPNQIKKVITECKNLIDTCHKAREINLERMNEDFGEHASKINLESYCRFLQIPLEDNEIIQENDHGLRL